MLRSCPGAQAELTDALFSTSVHNVGLKYIVFLTFCSVAKLALDEIRYKKNPYLILSLLFYHFPYIGPLFLKNCPYIKPYIFA